MTEAVPAVLPVVISELPGLLDGVAESLRDVDEGYAEFLVAARNEVMVPARAALTQLVRKAAELLHEGSAAVGPVIEDADVARALFEELGREQWRHDRPLGSLLAAFHVGGRVAWRRMSEAVSGVDVSPRMLAALAEALFALVDDLCEASIAGYVAEQAASASERERARDLLVERLLSDRSDSAAVAAAARAAGWALPRTAAVVLVRAADEAGREALERLGPDRLLFQRGSCSGAIIADPEGPGRRARLATQLRGTTALIGPAVPVSQLPESAGLAEAAADILPGTPGPAGPVYVADHLDALIVHRDSALMARLRERELEPLADAPAGLRAALGDTLRSWLVHMGNRRAVAAELEIHPQTVRYRLARLRELFGPALDDPEARLRLLLALAWEQPPGAPAQPVIGGSSPSPDAPAWGGRRGSSGAGRR